MPEICFQKAPGQDLAQNGRFPRIPEGEFNSRPRGRQMLEICFQKAPGQDLANPRADSPDWGLGLIIYLIYRDSCRAGSMQLDRLKLQGWLGKLCSPAKLAAASLPLGSARHLRGAVGWRAGLGFIEIIKGLGAEKTFFGVF